MKIMMIMLVSLYMTACYAEWDIPKTQRRDVCTGFVDNKYVYVQPSCPQLPAKHPRDLDSAGRR